MKLIDIPASFVIVFLFIICLFGAMIITLCKAMAALMIRGARFLSLVRIIFRNSNNFKVIFLTIIDITVLLFAIWFIAFKPSMESVINVCLVIIALIIAYLMLSRRKKRG